MGEIRISGSQPVGFPGCWRCPCLGSENVDICLACSTGRLTALTPARACAVCDQTIGGAETCSNDWCTRADRWFSVVWSVAPHVAAWRSVIRAYKYGPEMRWRVVLGRILVAYLDEHMPWFDDYDVLVPMPAFVGRGAHRHWDPVGQVVAVAAMLAGPRWDFAPGLVVKKSETPALAGLSRPARRTCAEGALRESLRVPDPTAVSGCRILVIDDVFTEGSTLREVARALILAGAEEVAGLTLARQPWRRAGSPPRRG